MGETTLEAPFQSLKSPLYREGGCLLHQVLPPFVCYGKLLFAGSSEDIKYYKINSYVHKDLFTLTSGGRGLLTAAPPPTLPLLLEDQRMPLSFLKVSNLDEFSDPMENREGGRAAPPRWPL